jgi:FeS assembly protein IscX
MTQSPPVENLNNMARDSVPALYWDSAYAIALALIAEHPNLNPEEVGLLELAGLVESLTGFRDDPELANERILVDIQITWFEELLSI